MVKKSMMVCASMSVFLNEKIICPASVQHLSSAPWPMFCLKEAPSLYIFFSRKIIYKDIDIVYYETLHLENTGQMDRWTDGLSRKK